MIKQLLFATAAALASFGANAAYSLTYEAIDASARTCRITGIENPDQVGATLTLPSTATGSLYGYNVVEIGRNALHDMPEVVTIILPPSITKIGDVDDYFYGHAYNFHNCPKLQRFVVSGTNTMFATSSDGLLLSKDGKTLFAMPQAFPVTDYSYTVPSTIVKFGYEAFQQNSTIRTLTISGAITSMGGNAGLNSMKLLSEIVTSTTTGSNFRAIQGSLINTADSRVVSFPPKKMAGTVSAPGGCTKIGDHAFANCIYLTALSNTYNITDIGVGAFAGSGIKTAQYESKLTSVDEYAFAGCPSLESITFKSQVADIPAHMASDSPKLTKVTYSAGNPTSIGKGAFANCTALAEHPFTNFQMGDSCFFNTGFTEVNFISSTPVALNNFKTRHAFDSCKKLTKIDASGYATTIDKPFGMANDYASNCPLLAEVRFPSYTQFIQNYYDNSRSPILYNVPSLTKIVLGWFERVDHALAPLFYFTGNGTVKPNIYIKNNGLITEGGTGAPLRLLCAPYTAGATVKPIYYWESCWVTSDYADTNAYYYMPGGCLDKFKQAADQGCVNEEFYRLQFKKRPYNGVTDCLTASTVEIYPTMVKLGMYQVNNAGTNYSFAANYGNFETSFGFNTVNSFTIHYTVHGESFTTTYPHAFIVANEAAGVEAIEIDNNDSPVEYFDLQGRRVDNPTSGLYIRRQGSSTTKEFIR